MAIINLDNVKFTKTNLGIHCPECGGVLKPNQQGAKWFHVVARAFTLGTMQAKFFECENCHKKYTLYDK